MHKYVSLIIISLLFSCKETQETKSNEIVLENERDTIPLVDEIITEATDTITYDESYFPIDSLLQVKILTENTFHEDEIEANSITKEWFGLFKNKDNYRLSKTKIIAKRVYDVILDEKETDKTGWEITTTSKDTSLVLIESLPYLSERKIERYDLPEYIQPNDTITFKYLNKEYKLFATGGKRKESEESEWYYVWNYKLYLTSIVNGIEQTELLVACSRFDDSMIRILFAGDIDGDEKLDLLLDTSNHYNASSPTLYLSKPAEEENKIIKPVAIHTSVGC